MARTKPKTLRVARTRNAGTLTEAAFWGWIRSALRKVSCRWRPRNEAKNRVKRPYIGPNKRQKVEYQCAECGGWFSEKQIEVDHLVPVGPLTCPEHLPGFVARLFVEVDGWRCLCKHCHDNKTYGTE